MLLGLSGWALTLLFATLLSAARVFFCTTHYARKQTVAVQVTPVDGSLRIGISSAPKLQVGDLLSDSLRHNQEGQLLAQRSLFEWLRDTLRAGMKHGR